MGMTGLTGKNRGLTRVRDSVGFSTLALSVFLFLIQAAPSWTAWDFSSSRSFPFGGERQGNKGTRQVPVHPSFGLRPLSFELNQGQADPHVRFLCRGEGYGLFLCSGEVVLSLQGQKSSGTQNHFVPPLPADVIHLKLKNANPKSIARGLDRLPGHSNYFIGNDPHHWRTNVPQYAKVKYTDIYPGIDLVYYGNQGQMEYDFVVKPGADPRIIQWDVEGTQKGRMDSEGNWILATPGGETILKSPVCYQTREGFRQPIPGRYALRGNKGLAFEIGDYRRDEPLVIDPILTYSTYLGGSGHDNGTGIAVDSSGNVYITGGTTSSNFPVTNAYQPYMPNSSTDGFIAKLNPSGSVLIYSTYLGADLVSGGNAIAVDEDGNAYVAGYTESHNFPVTNAFQTTLGNGAISNAFVAKLNPSGNTLLYSSYLGGLDQDSGTGIALDSSRCVYVTGYTNSHNFPTTLAYQPALGAPGATNAFISKVNASGTTLLYSTFLGGSGVDQATGIVVDSSDCAYVAGYTTSSNFPISNAYQSSLAVGAVQNAFVTKINAAGSALVYSTYLGGNKTDFGMGIALASGNAYVVGTTNSTNFPTTGGAIRSALGTAAANAFVTELNGSGNGLLYSTYLGGSVSDQGTGIGVDSAGNFYVTGYTTSHDFPTVDPLQSSLASAGNSDVFVAKFNPAGNSLLYSTYLGGSSVDAGAAIAVDSFGSAYVTGATQSTKFPTVTPVQPNLAGVTNAFVFKIFSSSDYTGSAPPQPGTCFTYPAPATGNQLKFAFYMNGAGLAAIRVWNERGDLVTQFSQTLGSGAQTVPLDISRFTSGVYFYRITLNYVSGASEKLNTNKFMVKK